MPGSVIETAFSEAELLSGLICRAFLRHDFDGNVVVEGPRGSQLWVARLECTLCGTKRVTKYWPTPEFDPITPNSPHRYTPGSNIDETMTHKAARVIVMKRLMKNR